MVLFARHIYGATTFSIMTLIIMIFRITSLSIKDLNLTFTISDTQHNETNDIQHNGTQHNDSQHNGTQHNDSQHNDTQHNDTHHYHIQHNVIQHQGLTCNTQHHALMTPSITMLCHSANCRV